jgi:DNA modification methylase
MENSQKESRVSLIHGDCLEEMKKIPDNSVDMCLTDPP